MTLPALRLSALTSRLVPLAATLALAWLLTGPSFPGADQPAPLGGQPSFVMSVAPGSGDGSHLPPEGAVFVNESDDAREMWGTYLAGDGFTGEVLSAPFLAPPGEWWIPVLGYPEKEGNALLLELLSPTDEVLQTLRYSGEPPGESLRWWQPALTFTEPTRVRLRLIDQSTQPGGWLGVGPPRQIPAWTIGDDGMRRAYPYYVACGVALAALLLVPGALLARWRPRHPWAELGWQPVPGLLLLAALGVLLWWGGAALARVVLPAYAGLMLLGALGLTLRPARSAVPARLAAVCFACLVIATAAFSAIPIPVAQEFNRGSSFRGRMVASPPDHLIPYYTAAYLFRGYDGREMSDMYLGPDWSLASRGPLLPFTVNTALHLFRLAPTEDPRPDNLRWPAATDGYFLSRWLGILANALVVFGAAAVLQALGITSRRHLALVFAGLALAPVLAINTVFLWPKLLATYFILLALAESLGRGSLRRMGLAGALAYLSHPVGALMLPAFALFVAIAHYRARRTAAPPAPPTPAIIGGLTRALILAGWVALFAAPWLLFKLHLGHEDKFLQYPLGDGRGFETAASFSSWLATRWSNLWLSLIPGAFYASPHMGAWLEGALTAPQRWVIGYAKSLPGHLTFTGYALVLGGLAAAVLRGTRPGVIALTFALPSLLVMLVFWGYSSDGLGRNCLEPFSVLVALLGFAAITKPRWQLIAGVLLVLAWGEWTVATLGGFVVEDRHGWWRWTTEVRLLAALAAAAAMFPLLLMLRPPRPPQNAPPSPES